MICIFSSTKRGQKLILFITTILTLYFHNSNVDSEKLKKKACYKKESPYHLRTLVKLQAL